MKKNFLIIIIILTIIIIIGGVYYYFREQNINYCKDKCLYFGSSSYWYNSRNFENQEQCVDYCLRNKK